MSLVYRHINPKTLEVFYVGISSNKGRAKNHKRAYEFSVGRNTFYKNYISKHGIPIVEILKENITWEEACELEVFLIELYGRRDLNKGNLLNLTDGGEGNNCQYFSKETRIKMSKSAKGRVPWNKGKKLNYKVIISQETKVKISKSKLGKARPKGFQDGEKNHRSKLVLDTQNGIYYFSAKEASSFSNFSYDKIKRMLNGSLTNFSNLIYC